MIMIMVMKIKMMTIILIAVNRFKGYHLELIFSEIKLYPYFKPWTEKVLLKH